MPPPYTRKVYSWPVRVLIAVDILANVATGGQLETISSRLGKRKLARGGTLQWHDWLGAAKPLDWVLDKLDRGHSLDAIDFDRGDPPKPPKV